MHPPPPRHTQAFTLVQLLVALAISALVTLTLVTFLGRSVTAEGQTLSQASATVQADSLSTAIAQDFRRTGSFVAFQAGNAQGFTALFTDGPGLTVRNASDSFAQQSGFSDPGLNLTVGDLVLIVNSQGKAQLSQVTASAGGQVSTSCANGVAYLPDGVTVYKAHTLTLARDGQALTRSLDRTPPQVVLKDASGAQFTYLYEQPAGPLLQDPAGLPASTTGTARLAALLPRVTSPGSVNAVTSQTQVPARPPAWAALPGARIGSCLPASPDVNAVTVRLGVSGLPSGTAANVTMRGPGIEGQRATASTSFSNLTPGTFSASAQNVTVNGVTYAPTVKPASVQLYGRGASGFLLAEYKPMTATLNVVVSGLPGGVNAYVSLQGGGAGSAFNPVPGSVIDRTTTLTPPGGTTKYQLMPGSWQSTVYAAWAGSDGYNGTISPASLNAVSGQTYTLYVNYTKYAPPPPPPPPPPPAPTPTPPPPPPPPSAGNVKVDFTTTPWCGTTVDFTASGSPAGGTYAWTFGDGGQASTPNALTTHAYRGNGPYTASVTYTVNGQSATRSYVVSTVQQNAQITSFNTGVGNTTAFVLNETPNDGGPVNGVEWSVAEGINYSPSTSMVNAMSGGAHVTPNATQGASKWKLPTMPDPSYNNWPYLAITLPSNVQHVCLQGTMVPSGRTGDSDVAIARTPTPSLPKMGPGTGGTPFSPPTAIIPVRPGSFIPGPCPLMWVFVGCQPNAPAPIITYIPRGDFSIEIPLSMLWEGKLMLEFGVPYDPVSGTTNYPPNSSSPRYAAGDIAFLLSNLRVAYTTGSYGPGLGHY